MWITADVASAVNRQSFIFYVNRATQKLWNSMRPPGEPAVLTGWHWAKGSIEAGPFKSKAAAYRDAWFTLVRKAQTPAMHALAVRANAPPGLRVVSPPEQSPGRRPQRRAA